MRSPTRSRHTAPSSTPLRCGPTWWCGQWRGSDPREQARASMEGTMPGHASRLLAAAVAAAICSTPLAAKECYAPDARAQERAFSRAVTTEGGKVVWLGGQTGSATSSFDDQVREIFSALEKTIKAVGGSGLKDITTMTVFITDARLGDRLT